MCFFVIGARSACLAFGLKENPLLMTNEHIVTKTITTIRLVTNGNPNIIITSLSICVGDLNCVNQNHLLLSSNHPFESLNQFYLPQFRD